MTKRKGNHWLYRYELEDRVGGAREVGSRKDGVLYCVHMSSRWEGVPGTVLV